MGMRLRYIIVLLTGVTVGCSSGPIDLPAALATAEAGDTIDVTAGEYVGNFVVPAGVTLEGDEGAVIRGEAGAPALVMMPGSSASEPTSIKGLTIHTEDIGVLSVGSGYVAMEDVAVHATLGMAVVLDDCNATLTNVDLIGTIDGEDSSALMLDSVFESDKVSVVGLAANKADLTISNLNITGFVGYGAALYQGIAHWNGGVLQWNVGVNVMNEASTLTLENVHIKDSLQSRNMQFKRPSYGLVSSTDSITTTNSVTIERIQGAGVLIHEAVSNVHDTLKVSRCSFTGVHLQNGSGATEFVASEFHENQRTGLSLLKAGEVDIVDSGVFDTIVVGAQITSEDLVIGYGLQIADGDAQVDLDGVLLEDNQVVGLLLDGENLNVTASDVTIGLRDLTCSDAHEDCFGVQNQNGASLPSGLNVSEALEDVSESLGDFPVTQEEQVVQSIKNLAGWIPENGGYVAGNTLQIGADGIQ